jgi:two-component system chemotaxis response regulator CheY
MNSKKIIYVDDSPTMRRIIQNALNKIGYFDIIEAENGVDALEKLEGKDVDLVLTDWNMPEMNGEQLVKELRGSKLYRDKPILMITTRGIKEDVLKAVQMGVNGYIVKPFTPEILKKKIDDIMS